MKVHRNRSLLLPATFAVLGALLVAGSVVDATAGERVRLRPLNGAQGVRSLPAPEIARHGTDPSGAHHVQVQGVVRGSGSDAVRIGRRAIHLDPRTAIQSIVPAHGEANLRPRLLSGRSVTVYGRAKAGGKIVEATLVIVQPEPHEVLALVRRTGPPVDESRYIIPGASAGAGRLRPGAPQ